MAKKRKNKKRDRYTTGGRVDMRTGGRVAKQTGGDRFRNQMVGEPERILVDPSRDRQQEDPVTTPQRVDLPQPRFGLPPQFSGLGNTQNVRSDRDVINLRNMDRNIQPLRRDERDTVTDREQQENELEPIDNVYGIPQSLWDNMTDEQKQEIIDAYNANNDSGEGDEGGDAGNNDADGGDGDDGGINEVPLDAAEERKQRVARTGVRAEQIARGEVLPPEAARLQEENLARVSGDIQLEDRPEFRIQPTRQARAGRITDIPTEQVTLAGEAAQAVRPGEIEPARMGAVLVGEAAKVTAARGEVSDQSLAEAAGVDRVPTIEGATVEIPEGALTERVVGTISPEAKANAARVAGTELARVTRAKKQLSNAGLTTDQIDSLGNDPEALEARLMDLTEAERGIIEGLPVEALVSNQLDTLLTGMEDGNIPSWASPAVAAVEQMLAARGMTASTVGRDSLFNAIIQSAIPLAQANAQSIQQSVAQQKTIEATAELKSAEFRQQTAMQNAQNVFNMDMAQFNADQQTALSNSKFMQTIGLTEANNRQQSAIQDAVLLSQANLAEADQNTKLAIQNAQAFLQMDMTNLSNAQQAEMVNGQYEQQRLLSNQAATNAAAQFNATSENQTNQFMASLSTQVSQFNAQQRNAMEQFNVSQTNAAEARRAQNMFEANKINATLATQIDQFNSQLEYNRNQFNAQNATAIAQSNIAWRRQANTANTAATNAMNQFNAQNAFNLSSQAQAFLWQELRDQADYDFKSWDNERQRLASVYIAALGNEGLNFQEKNWSSEIQAVTNIFKNMWG
jgi:hypothetical protein